MGKGKSDDKLFSLKATAEGDLFVLDLKSVYGTVALSGSVEQVATLLSAVVAAAVRAAKSGEEDS